MYSTYFKTKSQNEKWSESTQSSQTWSVCSSAGSRDWLLCYITWDGAVPVLGEGGTGCCSQAPEPCSSKIPTCSISSPPQFSHKKQSGSNTQNQLLAAMEWLEEHWTLTEHGQRCQQPRARPAAPPWVLLPAVELSPNTVQLCVHGAEWWANSSAVRAAWGTAARNSTQGFSALTQELPVRLLSCFAGMPLHCFTPCAGSLLTGAAGFRLHTLWHCGFASDEQTTTWAQRTSQAGPWQPTASSVSRPKEHSCQNKKSKSESKAFILNVFSQPVPAIDYKPKQWNEMLGKLL